MENCQRENELPIDRMEAARERNHVLGVYRPGFRFIKESLLFFQQCVGKETYTRAMQSEAGKQHHFVVARAFLKQADWEKFVWIEEFGSLAGFPDR